MPDDRPIVRDANNNGTLGLPTSWLKFANLGAIIIVVGMWIIQWNDMRQELAAARIKREEIKIMVQQNAERFDKMDQSLAEMRGIGAAIQANQRLIIEAQRDETGLLGRLVAFYERDGRLPRKAPRGDGKKKDSEESDTKDRDQQESGELK